MIGHSVLANLPTLQAEAESLLTDVGELQAITGSTTDPNNGQRVDTWAAYWSGPIRVRVTLSEQQTTTGGQDVTILRAVVSVPVSVAGITTQHRVVPTVSRDAAAVGVPFYVKSIPYGSQMVLRRLSVSTEQG